MVIGGPVSSLFTRISLLPTRPARGKARQGEVLARHEGDLHVDAEQPLSLDELLSLLGSTAEDEALSREDAIACYLSASQGWPDAVKRLGGTFAQEAAGLRQRKSD